MEKIVRQGLLYDFYGELLTEHQRHIYEDVVFNDLSLSEIAQDQGISRQGVHDLVKRCDRILEGYEGKLHLVEKFQVTKKLAGQIEGLLDSYQREQKAAFLEEAKEAARRIVEI
ncbi:MAG: YlxM family DNA-binding protein [Hungatella sp.]|mgnify:CR=1 FL=1|nr:YlxM family DNA-binding protein [Hungatella sp.]